MKEDAYTVTRIDETIYDIESFDKMKMKRHIVITLLNKKASYASEVDVYYTEDIDKISDFQIKIYDAHGELVKKVKNKDISDVSVYDGFSMANDRRVLTYKSSYSNYPYTIEYEYEEESKFTAFISSWYPSFNFYNSVEFSRFKINAPADFTINFKSKNQENYNDEIVIDSVNLQFEARGLHAIEPEGKMPNRVLPRTLFSPAKSVLDKTQVSYTDWESFGMWMYDAYLSDKNNLSDETTKEVLESVSGLSSDFEKAKAIFEGSVNSTRYISIQLGEGGWEPFYAQETHDRKYGDCKALSMYTLSLMEKAGLDPFYVIIYGNTSNSLDLEENFASIQGNHAIIGIPIEGDTIYADCTSSYNPFGYKSGFTDGRLALAVNKSGGKIVRTAKYEDQENKESISTKIEINTKERMLELDVKNKLEGLRISDRLSLGAYTEKQILEDKYPAFYPALRKETFEDLSYDLLNEKTLIENFEINSRNFISVAGDYLLLPIHLHENQLRKLDAKDRKFPIYVKNGFDKNYEYTIDIPSEFELGKLPEATLIKSIFGEWRFAIIETTDLILKYEVSLHVKSGTFENSKVDEYNSWLDDINKHLKNNITFKRKEK